MQFETAQALLEALSAPFGVEDIQWRVGPTNAKNVKEGDPVKGQPLIYVDVRTVMDRLDRVCGLDGWQSNYTPGVNGSIVCNIGVRMPDGAWVWKADGAGETDMDGEKGALSDAFKRAGVRFGIARYLYEIKANWITLETKGRSHFIGEKELRALNALHEKYVETMGWGPRREVVAYKFAHSVIKHFVTDARSAQEMKQLNEGTIAAMPVAMKRHLYETLDRIGGRNSEAAE